MNDNLSVHMLKNMYFTTFQKNTDLLLYSYKVF